MSATLAARPRVGRAHPSIRPATVLRESTTARTLRWALLTLAVVVALLPFLWMLRTALGPPATLLGMSANPVPSELRVQNFSTAWNAVGLGTALTNGIIVSLSILVLQVLTAVPAAYAFACLHFRGRNALFALVLATLLVPTQVLAVPNYVTVSGLGFPDTKVGLILPFIVNAFGIFLLRQYMTTIPQGVLEAARMDGLGTIRTLWRIVVPLSTPAIATLATFSFLLSFNEYLWPLLVARSPGNYTPSLALAVYAGASGLPDYAILSAAAAVITLPTLVVFLVAQRRLTAGLTGTGAS